MCCDTQYLAFCSCVQLYLKASGLAFQTVVSAYPYSPVTGVCMPLLHAYKRVTIAVCANMRMYADVVQELCPAFCGAMRRLVPQSASRSFNGCVHVRACAFLVFWLISVVLPLHIRSLCCCLWKVLVMLMAAG